MPFSSEDLYPIVDDAQSFCFPWFLVLVHPEEKLRYPWKKNDEKLWKKGKYSGEWQNNYKNIKGKYEKNEVIGDIFYLRKRAQLALKWHLCFVFFLKKITTSGKIFHDRWSQHISPLLTGWLRISGENLNKKMFKKNEGK